MESTSWTDGVRNVEVLQRAKEERNVLHTVKRREVNWTGHVLSRNCRLKYVSDGKMEGSIEVTGRWERRRKQLFEDLEKKRGCSKLKEENQLSFSGEFALEEVWVCRKRDYGINAILLRESVLCTRIDIGACVESVTKAWGVYELSKRLSASQKRLCFLK